MEKRISLPKVTTKKDAKAHPFPFQIALQAEEYIHGATFYYVLADEAAGEFFHLPNSIDTLKNSIFEDGMQEQEWILGWDILKKYKNMFEKFVFYNVLIIIRSYWDWYINKLSDFVIFAQESTSNALIKSEVGQLRRITYPEIVKQLEILENICLLDFNISDESKRHIKEMSLVRNLGLHNRWEVDEQYLNKTSKKNKFQIGDIRDFNAKELIVWHKSLSEIINKTCSPIAIKYLSAPVYPPSP